jgi:GTPase SAR1 family protein
LVGNKLDLESNREVSYQEGEEYAKSKGISFIEISSTKLESVERLFQDLAKNYLREIEFEKLKSKKKSKISLFSSISTVDDFEF